MSINRSLSFALSIALLSISHPVYAQYQFDPSPSKGDKVADRYCRNLAYRYAEREAYSGTLQGVTRGVSRRAILGGIMGRSPSKVSILGAASRPRQSESWQSTYSREYSNCIRRNNDFSY